MITLSKIAQLAHVSVSTASKAFSMSSEVSEQTRQEIFRIAKEYGCFKKFYNAKYPKYVVAVICPEFHGRHYSGMVAALQDELRSRNCEICVASTDFSEETERSLLEYYHNYANVDGIIMIGGKVPISESYEIPVVSVVPNCRHPIGICLRVDYRQALTRLVGHFQAEGIGPIGFISERYTLGKLQIFRQVMRKAGLPCQHVVTGGRFESGGYRSMEKLLAAEDRPRAVVCAYDHLAIGAMRCLADHGLRVPEDVAIVGMDNIPEAQYLIPGLSSIDFCIEETCRKAAESIVGLIGGSEEIFSRTLPAKLMLRESSELPGQDV